MSISLYYVINLETHVIEEVDYLKEINVNELMIVLKDVVFNERNRETFLQEYYLKYNLKVEPRIIHVLSSVPSQFNLFMVYTHRITDNDQPSKNMWILYHTNVDVLQNFNPLLVNHIVFRDFSDMWVRKDIGNIYTRHFCLTPIQ